MTEKKKILAALADKKNPDPLDLIVAEMMVQAQKMKENNLKIAASINSAITRIDEYTNDN